MRRDTTHARRPNEHAFRLPPVTVLAIALAVAVAGQLQAQVVRETVRPGTIIRIHVPDSTVLTVRLATQLTPGSTSVEYCALTWDACSADPATTTSRPLTGLRRLDARHTESLFWALVGAVVGTELGDRAARGFDTHPASVILIGTGPFAGLGAILGSAIPRWVRVF